MFHITDGTKKYLWVPVSLKNIQDRNATVGEREEGKGDRVGFLKKRGIVWGVTETTRYCFRCYISLKKCLRNKQGSNIISR